MKSVNTKKKYDIAYCVFVGLAFITVIIWQIFRLPLSSWLLTDLPLTDSSFVILQIQVTIAVLPLAIIALIRATFWILRRQACCPLSAPAPLFHPRGSRIVPEAAASYACTAASASSGHTGSPSWPWWPGSAPLPVSPRSSPAGPEELRPHTSSS